jgi:hypothetical protein
MNKHLLFAVVLAVGLVATLLLVQKHPAAQAEREPAIETRAEPPASTAQMETPVTSSLPRTPEGSSLEAQILDLWAQQRSPQEMAALLKELYRKDPEGLFKTLLSLSQAPLETRRTLVPLLARALTLWPEAEGRYIFPVADAYGEMDLPGAAEWAASFLGTTGRSDLAAATLVGRLAETSEERALALISALPDAPRKEAINSVANYISIADLNHLLGVCGKLDPDGSTFFSKLLFQRLAMERLNDTAEWLARTPEAQRIPGAVAAIVQGLVIGGDPKAAISWADGLPDQIARGQAVAQVYQQWAHDSPENAIQDILSAYPGALQLMADVFKGAAEHHGSGATMHWDTACKLENPSARAYALSALIEPMLLTSGLAETQTRIDGLAPNSLERTVAEIIMQNTLKKPVVATHLRNGSQ